MADARQAPDKAGLVLLSLILVAAVANLNLSVANVALPDIGAAFSASQTALDLVAVGYSLGLAASVLWLGALGDRYGRKLMLILGVLLSIPACLAGRVRADDRGPDRRPDRRRGVGRHGLSRRRWPSSPRCGRAPDGPGRSPSGRRSAARSRRWGRSCPGSSSSDSSGAPSSSSPSRSPSLRWSWRSASCRPTSTRRPRRSTTWAGSCRRCWSGRSILGINFAPVPNEGRLALALFAIAIVAGVAFVIRQRRVANPLYDLDIASRRVFWVAAVAGIIVFGSLMGAMFIGQQYLQNVLGYSTLEAGAAIIPAALFMVIVAPRSAKLVGARGARFTLLLGYVFVMLGFLTMFLLWNDGSAVLAGRARVLVRRDRRRFRRDAGIAFTDRLGAGHAGRDGVGDSRPPARPRRRVHAVDLRRLADRRLCGRRGDGDRRLPRMPTRSRAAPRPSS